MTETTENTVEQTAYDRMVCANHPNRETSLRCNRCEKPICTKCAVLTPTGYRCKECVRGQQKVFDTALPTDFVVGALVAGLLSFLGSLIVPVVGFFTIFLAPFAGGIIAEVVRRLISRRRSKRLFQITAGAVALGALVPMCAGIFQAFILYSGAEPLSLVSFLGFSFLWRGVYAFLTASTMYARLSGFKL